mgnify:FL=1
MVKEKRTKENLPQKSIWETSLVLDVFREMNASPKRANKIWKHLIENPVDQLNDIPFDTWMIAKKVSTALKQDYSLFTSRVVQQEVSIRGDTTKLIIELQDGHRVSATTNVVL